MFLGNKDRNVKGNLIAQFVVLLVVAVILILVVTSFGAKIWSAFFPNSDKSTVKSFDMVYQVLNLKSISEKDYDYTPLNVYMKENYRMLFFKESLLNCGEKTTQITAGDDTVQTYTGTSEVTYYRPTTCEDQQCLCLYKDEPSKILKEKDRYVVKCYQVMKKINIDPKLFQLNYKVCQAGTNTQVSSGSSSGTDTAYGSYLFIKYNKYDPDTKELTPYVYVLLDTDANRKINEDLSIPRCHKSSDPLSALCIGEKEGTIITAEKEGEIDTLNTIYEGCKNNNLKSTSITCTFNNNDNQECIASCIAGDESSKCTTKYKTCGGYNQIPGLSGLNYISPTYDYKYTYMCENNANYCDFATGCQIHSLLIYAYKSDPSGGFDPKNNPDLATQITSCNAYYNIALETRTHKRFYTSYNTTNEECNNLFKDKFYESPQQIMACAPDNLDKCKTFIDDKTTECELKFIKQSPNYWLTSYNTNTCPEIEEMFIPVNFCVDTPAAAPVVP